MTEMTLVAEIVDDGYEWEAFGVFTDGTSLFWATDAGCSCYYAWEHDPEYTPGGFAEIDAACAEWCGTEGGVLHLERVDMMRAVAAYLGAQAEAL